MNRLTDILCEACCPTKPARIILPQVDMWSAESVNMDTVQIINQRKQLGLFVKALADDCNRKVLGKVVQRGVL